MYDDQWDEEVDPDDWLERVDRFADPGGDSALHRAGADNPRNLPCPTCDAENVLTPRDVQAGYQCDHCADVAEGKIPPSFSDY